MTIIAQPLGDGLADDTPPTVQGRLAALVEELADAVRKYDNMQESLCGSIDRLSTSIGAIPDG